MLMYHPTPNHLVFLSVVAVKFSSAIIGLSTPYVNNFGSNTVINNSVYFHSNVVFSDN